MTDQPLNPLQETTAETDASIAAERRARIEEFVRTNPDYYERQFNVIGSSSRFTPTFNFFAGLFGQV